MKASLLFLRGTFISTIRQDKREYREFISSSFRLALLASFTTSANTPVGNRGKQKQTEQTRKLVLTDDQTDR